MVVRGTLGGGCTSSRGDEPIPAGAITPDHYVGPRVADKGKGDRPRRVVDRLGKGGERYPGPGIAEDAEGAQLNRGDPGDRGRGGGRSTRRGADDDPDCEGKRGDDREEGEEGGEVKTRVFHNRDNTHPNAKAISIHVGIAPTLTQLLLGDKVHPPHAKPF